MDRYMKSKRNLVILKSKLRKLEEKRRLEEARKRLVKKIIVSIVSFGVLVGICFAFY